MVIPLLLFLMALMACSALALVLGALSRQRRSLVAVSAILGYLLAGATVWWLASPEWTLSFPETLTASVDAGTYGHPVEHYAESLLVVMLAACVLGSVLFGTVAAFGGHVLRRANSH